MLSPICLWLVTSRYFWSITIRVGPPYSTKTPAMKVTDGTSVASWLVFIMWASHLYSGILSTLPRGRRMCASSSSSSAPPHLLSFLQPINTVTPELSPFWQHSPSRWCKPSHSFQFHYPRTSDLFLYLSLPDLQSKFPLSISTCLSDILKLPHLLTMLWVFPLNSASPTILPISVNVIFTLLVAQAKDLGVPLGSSHTSYSNNSKPSWVCSLSVSAIQPSHSSIVSWLAVSCLSPSDSHKQASLFSSWTLYGSLLRGPGWPYYPIPLPRTSHWPEFLQRKNCLHGPSHCTITLSFPSHSYTF